MEKGEREFARTGKKLGETHSHHVRHFRDVPLGDVAVEGRVFKHVTGRERACAQRGEISEGKEPDGTGLNEETQRSRTTTYQVRE